MKKHKKQLVIIGCMIINLMGCEAKAESIYPTMQEIYDDCTQAVNLVQTDMKGFLRTGCAKQISGFLGAYLLTIQSLPIVNSADSCAVAKNALIEDFTNRLCFPQEWKKSIYPYEWHIAMKISENKGNIRTEEMPLGMNLASIIFQLYSCN